MNIPDIRIEAHPWVTEEQYRPNIEVRWGGSGNSSMKMFSRAASEWDGTADFTGFGFKPTSYIVHAWSDESESYPALSIWGYDGTNEFYWGASGNGGGVAASSYVLRVKDSTTNVTRASHNAFLSDGVQLDFLLTNSGQDINWIIIAFK